MGIFAGMYLLYVVYPKNISADLLCSSSNKAPLNSSHFRSHKAVYWLLGVFGHF